MSIWFNRVSIVLFLLFIFSFSAQSLAQNTSCEQLEDLNLFESIGNDRVSNLKKSVNLVFHVIQDSANHHTLDDDTAKLFISKILSLSNYYLRNNIQLKLYEGNVAPDILPINFTFNTANTSYPSYDSDNDGILFWKLPIWYYNKKSPGLPCSFTSFDFSDISVSTNDNNFHVFLLENGCLALNDTASETATGQAFGANVAALYNVYRSYKLHPNRNNVIDIYARTLAHEIFHLFDLNHTNWSGCDDIPNGTNRDWCGANSSNNLMDYGCQARALSPCQINKLNKVALTTQRSRVNFEGNYPIAGAPQYVVDFKRMRAIVYNSNLSMHEKNMWSVGEDLDVDAVSNNDTLFFSLLDRASSKLKLSLRTMNNRSGSISSRQTIEINFPNLTILDGANYHFKVGTSANQGGLVLKAHVFSPYTGAWRNPPSYWTINTSKSDACLTRDYGSFVGITYPNEAKATMTDDSLFLNYYVHLRYNTFIKVSDTIVKQAKVCSDQGSQKIFRGLNKDGWILQTSLNHKDNIEIDWTVRTWYDDPTDPEIFSKEYSGKSISYFQRTKSIKYFSKVTAEIYDYNQGCKYELLDQFNPSIYINFNRPDQSIAANIRYIKWTQILQLEFKNYTDALNLSTRTNYASIIVNDRVLEPVSITNLGHDVYRLNYRVPAKSCDKLKIEAAVRYHPSANGFYEVSNTTQYYTVDGGVCNLSQQKSAQLISYPNPAIDKTQVDISFRNLTSDAELCITSIDGLFENCMQIDPAKSTVDIDLTQYQKGLYIMSIRDQGQTIVSGKLFVQ